MDVRALVMRRRWRWGRRFERKKGVVPLFAKLELMRNLLGH